MKEKQKQVQRKGGYSYNMIIQFKEPNPEIWESYYGYFPYLGWEDYVYWWHRTY
ncbi:hypothetical protein NIES2104_65110 [Leptolyngbya sp. NIES-2104]|nr:hypothetical protein NIES2104_65110 [Leptolyngbya sp. NIES-2104]